MAATLMEITTELRIVAAFQAEAAEECAKLRSGMNPATVEVFSKMLGDIGTRLSTAIDALEAALPPAPADTETPA